MIKLTKEFVNRLVGLSCRDSFDTPVYLEINGVKYQILECYELYQFNETKRIVSLIELGSNYITQTHSLHLCYETYEEKIVGSVTHFVNRQMKPLDEIGVWFWDYRYFYPNEKEITIETIKFVDS